MNSSEIVSAVLSRLKRNVLLTRGCLVAIVALFALGTYLLCVHFSPTAAIFASLLAAATTGYLLRSHWLPVPTAVEAGQLIDEKLGSKERVSAIVSFQDTDTDAAKISIIEAQLQPLLANSNPEAFTRFLIAPPIHRLLVAGILWSALAGCLSWWLRPQPQPRVEEAQQIRELLQDPNLPEEVKPVLQELADALADGDSLDSIESALQRAEAELSQSAEVLSATAPEESVLSASPTAEGIAPTPTPTATPTTAPHQTEERKDESSQEEKKQGDSEKGQSSQQGGKNKSDAEQGQTGDSSNPQGSKGAGAGANSPNPEGKEQQGTGASKGGAQKDQQSGDQGAEGQNKGQQNQGQGEKEGEKGSDQGEAKSKPSEGQQQQGEQKEQQAVAAAQAAVAEVKEKLEQQKQSDSAQGQEGKSPSNTGQPENKPGSAEKQQQNQQGKGEGQGRGDQKAERQSGEPSKDKEGKGKESGNEGSPNEGNDPQRDSPKQSSNNAQGSALPSVGEQGTPERPGEDGPSGGGIQGPKGFKEEVIKEAIDALDPRFTGADGTLAKNTKEAEAKLKVGEVTLAKPENSQNAEEQPIPPEYRDILGR